MSATLDISQEAAQLVALDRDLAYEHELARWLEPDRRDVLAKLIAAVVASDARPTTPGLQWPVDLVSYVPERDLPILAAAAHHAAKNPRVGEPPAGAALKGFDAAALLVLNSMLYEDHLPESILAAVTRQIAPTGKPSPKPRRRSKAAPAQMRPTHHLSLSFSDRCRTAREPFEHFARRHHPTWALEDSTSAVPVHLGGVREDARAAASAVAIMRIDDLAALVPGSTFGALDIDLPTDVLLDFVNAHVVHDERGRLRDVKYDDGRDMGEPCERELMLCEARLVPTPARFVRQDWAWVQPSRELESLRGRADLHPVSRIPDLPRLQRGHAVPRAVRARLAVRGRGQPR